MLKINKTYTIFTQELEVSSKVNPYFAINGYTINYKDTEVKNGEEKSIDFIQVVAHYNSMKSECTHPVSVMVGFGGTYSATDAEKTKGNYDFYSDEFRNLISEISQIISKAMYNPKDIINESYMASTILCIATKMRKSCLRMYGMDFDDNTSNEYAMHISGIHAYVTNIIHTHLFKGFCIDDEIIDKQNTVDAYKEAKKNDKDKSKAYAVKEDEKMDRDLKQAETIMSKKHKRLREIEETMKKDMGENEYAKRNSRII